MTALRTDLLPAIRRKTRLASLGMVAALALTGSWAGAAVEVDQADARVRAAVEVEMEVAPRPSGG